MRRQQSNAIALTLVYCRAFEKEALEDDLHNSLRSVIARSRAVHCVAFLANSAAIGCKKTPCAPSRSALPPPREGYAGHPQPSTSQPPSSRCGAQASRRPQGCNSTEMAFSKWRGSWCIAPHHIHRPQTPCAQNGARNCSSNSTPPRVSGRNFAARPCGHRASPASTPSSGTC